MFIFGVSYLLTISIMSLQSDNTRRDCYYGASVAQKAFVGTKFESFDFYQSCLDNIKYANPLNRRDY